jgi:restriction system protein
VTFPGFVFLGLLAMGLAWAALQAVYQWMTRHWSIAVLVVVVLVAIAWMVVTGLAEERRQRRERLRRLRYTMDEIDAMTPAQFELACRDLMRRDGLAARHVGGSNDQAADVIAEDHAGKIIVMQCKHTTCRANVGVRVLYEVNGTARPSHGASIVIVATNGGFTNPAQDWAPRHTIHLLDRERLSRWAAQGHDLHDVLAITPPPETPASPTTGRP